MRTRECVLGVSLRQLSVYTHYTMKVEEGRGGGVGGGVGWRFFGEEINGFEATIFLNKVTIGEISERPLCKRKQTYHFFRQYLISYKK